MAILVSRYQGLGDVLMALVVCKGLSLKYGEKIFFGTSEEFFPLCERCSFIKKVFTEFDANTTSIDFDLKFNLQDRIDYLPICISGHRLNLMANICGLERQYIDVSFRFVPRIVEFKEAEIVLNSAGIKNNDFLIGLHLKSVADIRSWSILRYKALSRGLIRKGYKVIILERHAVRETFRNTEAILPTSTRLSQLIGLISSCDLIVCPDSGIMHLAGFLGVPFVALFGPIDPRYRVQYYDNYRVLFKDRIPCVPCWDFQMGFCEGDNYKKCMSAISVREVLREIEELKEEIPMGIRCF